ncbi:hypothetical protein DM01DRAFT_1338791 [Hesseltinella vesiculosa]|uniref:Uncharacterized protein n=1 Tax=Hesseltinella vesiculosa TaxID=101127 RepID=A0A1X2G8Q8_9FUNG|nr:hypothetical protein DM01DRAFT_1338791 [Hesseltinella vesiculosa]
MTDSSFNEGFRRHVLRNISDMINKDEMSYNMLALSNIRLVSPTPGPMEQYEADAGCPLDQGVCQEMNRLILTRATSFYPQDPHPLVFSEADVQGIHQALANLNNRAQLSLVSARSQLKHFASSLPPSKAVAVHHLAHMLQKLPGYETFRATSLGMLYDCFFEPIYKRNYDQLDIVWNDLTTVYHEELPVSYGVARAMHLVDEYGDYIEQDPVPHASQDMLQLGILSKSLIETQGMSAAMTFYMNDFDALFFVTEMHGGSFIMYQFAKLRFPRSTVSLSNFVSADTLNALAKIHFVFSRYCATQPTTK